MLADHHTLPPVGIFRPAPTNRGHALGRENLEGFNSHSSSAGESDPQSARGRQTGRRERIPRSSAQLPSPATGLSTTAGHGVLLGEGEQGNAPSGDGRLPHGRLGRDISLASDAKPGERHRARLNPSPSVRPSRSHPFTSERFHALLNSLFKVLCNFPSRYLFAIGLVENI